MLYRFIALSLFAMGWIFACGGSEPPRKSTLPAPARVTPEGGAQKAPPEPIDAGHSEVASPSISLEALPAPTLTSPPAVVEIQFPFAEQKIGLTQSNKYRVRLKVEHWVVAEDAGALEVQLDDFRARRVVDLKAPLRLKDLVPADRDLLPGEHLLTAWLVGPDGQTVKPTNQSGRGPAALVRFWIGERGPRSLDLKEPMIFYRQPRGTYNGPKAAQSAFLDFYLLNAQLGPSDSRLRVTFDGPDGVSTHSIHEWQPFRIVGLTSGDHRVTLELIDKDGKSLIGARTKAEGVITVNLDAPVPDESN